LEDDFVDTVIWHINNEDDLYEEDYRERDNIADYLWLAESYANNRDNENVAKDAENGNGGGDDDDDDDSDRY
jgi:hypothetical protein